MQSADVFTLEAHDWCVKIDAARGGLISECRWRGLEVFSTAKAKVWPAEAHAGCFPLVPYSNRIRDATFSFAGRNVSLPASGFAMPHALHGLGWRSPWILRDSRPDEVIWTQTIFGDAWPWPYQASQRLAVEGPRLTLTVEIENTGTRTMPAGIGLHPYFPRRPDLEISIRAGGVWQTDETNPGIPTCWSARDRTRMISIIVSQIGTGRPGWTTATRNCASISPRLRRFRMSLSIVRPTGAVFVWNRSHTSTMPRTSQRLIHCSEWTALSPGNA